MENHNPPVNMDGDMNKYITVPQQVQQVQVGQPMQQVQEMQQIQQVQPQVQQIQQVPSQVQQLQQVQSQVQQLQQVQSQVQHIQQVQQAQQVQVQQAQQVQAQVQQVQAQAQQIQQVQAQVQAQAAPQVQQVQVQNTDGVTTTTQQVTLVSNTLPNQSLGTLHDALTNRLNQNLNKMNAAVTVPTPQVFSMQTPSVQHQSKAQPEPQPTQILTRSRMQDLVREVDPNEQLDEDVEEILLQMADDFVESAITAACLLAKHRKSSTVEVKDLQLHLERNWNMWIPGFGTDELRPYKRSSVNDAHKQRLTLIRKTLKKY